MESTRTLLFFIVSFLILNIVAIFEQLVILTLWKKLLKKKKQLATEFVRGLGSDFATFVCEYKGGKAFLGELKMVAFVGIPPAVLVKDGEVVELSTDDALYLISRS